jgi:hypothetical protein
MLRCRCGKGLTARAASNCRGLFLNDALQESIGLGRLKQLQDASSRALAQRFQRRDDGSRWSPYYARVPWVLPYNCIFRYLLSGMTSLSTSLDMFELPSTYAWQSWNGISAFVRAAKRTPQGVFVSDMLAFGGGKRNTNPNDPQSAPTLDICTFYLSIQKV